MVGLLFILKAALTGAFALYLTQTIEPASATTGEWLRSFLVTWATLQAITGI